VVALLILAPACGNRADVTTAPGQAGEDRPVSSTDSVPAPPRQPEVTTPSLPITDLDRLLTDNPYEPDGKLGSVCWVATELTLMTLRLTMQPERADVAAFSTQLPEFAELLRVAEPNLPVDQLAFLQDVRRMVDEAQRAVSAAGADRGALGTELSKLTSQPTGEPLCA